MRLTSLSRSLRQSLAAALVAVTAASGQSVNGVVLEVDGATPAPYLVVVVHDSAGQVVTRGQTTAQGAFQLLLPTGGAYTIRALRVGYAPTVSAPFRVAAEGTATVRVVLAARRISLPLVTVRDRSHCAPTSSDASALVEVWDQARTALYGVANDQRGTGPLVEVITFESVEHIWPAAEPAHSIAPPRFIRGDSFRSRPAAELLRGGFAVSASDSIEFHAPDAYVLLDPAFAANYCFWLEPAPPERSDWLGIGVRPAARPRGTIGIEGILWLTRAGQLVRFDFRYVGLAREVADARPGGAVEFAQLPSGQWIVSRWTIRMPQMSTAWRTDGTPGGLRRGTVRENRLGRVVERGGAILSALWPGGSTTLGSRVLVLTARSRAGAQRLEGTRFTVAGRTVMADSAGVAVLDSVSPGMVAVRVQTPLMHDAGIAPDTVSVAAFPDTAAMYATVRMPSIDDIRLRLCPASRPGGDRVVAIGSVAWPDAPGGAPLPRLTRATDFTTTGPEPATLSVAADSSGRWHACDVPRNTSMVLWTERDGGRAALVRFRVPPSVDMAFVGPGAAQRARAPTALPTSTANAGPAGERLTVRVVAALDSAPLVDAQVVIDDSLVARPDRVGGYRLVGVPRGTHRLLVRKLGFAPTERSVVISEDSPDVRVALNRLPTLLSDVVISGRRIVASARFDDVLRRAASSTGDFFTRSDLGTVFDLRSLLATIPGVQVSGRGITFQRCQALAPGERAKVQVYVDGVKVTALVPKRIEFGSRALPLPESGTDVVIDAIRSVPPSDIEFVEVYRGVARIPAEFLDDACAVIAIWTRAY